MKSEHKIDPFIMTRISNAYFYEGGNRFRVLGEQSLQQKTIMELCNHPYVIRMDDPDEGKVYFAGDSDELWKRLIAEGKVVRGIWDLFESMRQELIQQGLSPDTSIYRWTLQEIWNHQSTNQKENNHVSR